ncbi:MAG: hypothetical protein COW00_02900 [Bdellovibrio sp. CG12_big_fil_rev_8_21_14_0_65_39_13]|nr:MAG: hypothetical protein COW78_00805 [Bdellovibrio sp. CG22_combo_CG10-13_8_21_14_all_39_27]PIQ61794.1 MAG: hypothetical protein COW00_02900 [Bdellovibrio sp. CG12_big_fil_rev_8_21_14_0_65_39_13]PIR33657.1 MAG: hypothetical protein COV37_15565 [Bdellovibrio sp. CG11_big_fil_rev_8_21_14_0_20_39_38]
MSTIKKISLERFKALTYCKKPLADHTGKELEWYSDENGRLIGTVILDTIDQDYSYVLLGRDETELFRAISLGTSYESVGLAQKALLNDFEAHLSKPDEFFFQGDRTKVKKDFYKPRVDKKKQHQNYTALISNPDFSPAKEIIKEIAVSFEDCDGNFFEQFQSNGFNARLWELFLYALFNESRFLIERKYDAPDFILTHFETGLPIAVEAVTVNKSLKNTDPESPKDHEKKELLKDFIPIKFGSPLFTKLKKEYWKKDHVKDMPIILAIHDYLYEDSMTWTRTGLERYLYGYEYDHHFDESGELKIIPKKINNHSWEGKTILSGFFDLPGAENISAVLFTNTATIPKFNRMGFLAEFGDIDTQMLRIGEYYDHDSNAVIPKEFSVPIELGKYSEEWAEGVMLYHNPNANIKIPFEFFDKFSHSVVLDGEWLAKLREFTPLSSKTIFLKK